MPLINVKVFKDELDMEQSTALISKITEAVTDVTSDKLRDATWVIIDEVNDGQWGVSGNALSLNDVKKMIAGD